jgi:hypothetical protein
VTLRTKLWTSSATLICSGFFLSALYFFHLNAVAWGWKVILVAAIESLVFLGVLSSVVGKPVSAFFAAMLGGICVRVALLIVVGYFLTMQGMSLALPLLSLVSLFLFFNVMQTTLLIFKNEF